MPSTTDTAFSAFDWQGHRGARGLMPENTTAGFLLALDFKEIKTLELDLAVSADRQLVLSHEPWFSSEICAHPDGRPVLESEQDSLLLFQHTYAQIKAFDCGSRPHPRFPSQKSAPAFKPLLQEVVAQAEQYARQQGRAMPYYNIEIKSKPEWDGLYTPAVEEFARLLLDFIQGAGIHSRACVQSFDVRALQAVRQLDPKLSLALLVENEEGLERNLQILGFVPNIYSPDHHLLSAELVQAAHEQRMQVIPWTVNDTLLMRQLIKMGVDGIITDYPDRLIPYNTVQAIRAAGPQ